jgi:glutamyl-tRNA reductase
LRPASCRPRLQLLTVSIVVSACASRVRPEDRSGSIDSCGDLMNLLLVGVNHRTARLADREALALTEDEIGALLTLVAGKGVVREAAVLSTCNRVEIYAAAPDTDVADRHVRDAVVALKGRDLLAPGGHRYALTGPAVVRHLFRVACALDSMIVGDVQILGQVKQGYSVARARGASGVLLDRLFEMALHAGKRARHETGVGTGTVSMAAAAVEFARHHAGTLAGRHVVIVGAGDTARLAAKHVAAHEPAEITIVNRDPAHGELLAADTGARYLPLDTLRDAIAAADVVFSATRAPHAIVTAETVRAAMTGRPHRPLTIMDLAVPRDVEEGAGRVPGVSLHPLDSVRARVGRAVTQRTAEVPHVEHIVEEEVARFAAWWRSLGAAPVVVALREHFERIRAEEVERAGGMTDRERDRADRLTRALVNRLLHVPTVRLKDLDPASSEGQWRLEAVRELFALPGTTGSQPIGTSVTGNAAGSRLRLKPGPTATTDRVHAPAVGRRDDA